jgi:hypothetical protein
VIAASAGGIGGLLAVHDTHGMASAGGDLDGAPDRECLQHG